MPYKIKKTSGSKPYKIVGPDGKIVGSSASRRDAEASIRARYSGERSKRK